MTARRESFGTMVAPALTLDRFGWGEDAAEGITLPAADGTVIDLEDA
jgi:hypothetical protein